MWWVGYGGVNIVTDTNSVGKTLEWFGLSGKMYRCPKRLMGRLERAVFFFKIRVWLKFKADMSD